MQRTKHWSEAPFCISFPWKCRIAFFLGKLDGWSLWRKSRCWSRLSGCKCLIDKKFVWEIYWINPGPVWAVNFFVWNKCLVTFIESNKLFKYILLMLEVFLDCFQNWFWVLVLRNNMTFLLVFFNKFLDWWEVGECSLFSLNRYQCGRGGRLPCCALGCGWLYCRCWTWCSWKFGVSRLLVKFTVYYYMCW